MLPTSYGGDKSPTLKQLHRLTSNPTARKLGVVALIGLTVATCAIFLLEGSTDELSGRRGVLHSKPANEPTSQSQALAKAQAQAQAQVSATISYSCRHGEVCCFVLQSHEASSLDSDDGAESKPFEEDNAGGAEHKPFAQPGDAATSHPAADADLAQVKQLQHRPPAAHRQGDSMGAAAPVPSPQAEPQVPKTPAAAASPVKAAPAKPAAASDAPVITSKQDQATSASTPPGGAAGGGVPTGQLPKLAADTPKQTFVKTMFQHAWKGYRDFAWGADALRPVSKTGDNNFLHMGATAVDAMDTLLIMGLMDEYHQAEDWVLQNLHFSSQSGVSVFETTIRVLGGLLAAYDLTETLMPVFGVDTPLSRRRPELLQRAKECADALKFAFNTDSGIPYGTVSLGPRPRAFNPGWTGGMSSTAEAATLQLEWEYLALATGKAEYANLARRTMQAFHKVEPSDHLLPIHIDPKKGSWGGSNIVTLGARGDSAYEYLVKQHVLSGGLQRKRHAWRGAAKHMPNAVDKSETRAWGAGALRGGKGQHPQSAALGNWAFEEHEVTYFDAVRSMYDGTVHGIKDLLVHQTTDSATDTPLVFISERLRGRIDHKMDHLVCFAGGMLGLGARTAWGAAPPDGWDKAQYLKHAKLAASGGGDDETLLRAQDADDMRLAAEITRTCHEMYAFTATKLAPEIVRFRDHAKGQGQVGSGGEQGLGMVVDPGAKHCLLRPEAVESFFVMFRLTGDERYREWGWEMAQAIESKARIESGGYSSVQDVTRDPPAYKDHQESFFLAETLKYLYLLFSDSDLIPLDKYVFNTEAHPLSIARGTSG